MFTTQQCGQSNTGWKKPTANCHLFWKHFHIQRTDFGIILEEKTFGSVHPYMKPVCFQYFYRAPFQNLLLKVTFVLMEALFFCCLILCCCKGRGLEPWASEELGETCWPREGTPAILGREEAGGGTTWGEDVVCCAKEDDEETEEEGGRPLSCRKTSNMDEVEVVAW